jgi:hypothetical protein
VRNLVRAGIPERVAMTTSGHKTRSVFERDDIVSDADLVEAANKLDAAGARAAEHRRHERNEGMAVRQGFEPWIQVLARITV